MKAPNTTVRHFRFMINFIKSISEFHIYSTSLITSSQKAKNQIIFGQILVFQF